jgi:hypothetical protein
VDTSRRDYVNPETGTVFDCIAYYTESPNVIACCAKYDDVYIATMGIPFVRRLVKICRQIDIPLQVRTLPERNSIKWYPDDELTKLLQPDVLVSKKEADAIVSTWPAATLDQVQIDLNEYALFYDLLLLIWCHEWSHVLQGHVDAASRELGITELYEFSIERYVGQSVLSTVNPTLLLQNFELHADQVAIYYCVRRILAGSDPAGAMAGLASSLVERLLFLNIACCIFAVVWWIAELRRADNDPTKATHPPAPLRYMRFRTFQRQLVQAIDPSCNLHVDALSYKYIEILSQLSNDFSSLLAITPFFFQTPSMQQLDEYEAVVATAAPAMLQILRGLNYEQTDDPFAPDALEKLMAKAKERLSYEQTVALETLVAKLEEKTKHHGL